MCVALFVRATNRKIFKVANEFMSGMKSGPLTTGRFITSKYRKSRTSFSRGRFR